MKRDKKGEKKVNSDFFDRMSKTDTFASADMKGKNHFSVSRITPDHSNSHSNAWSKRKQEEKKVNSDLFDRMSKTDTFASADMKGKNHVPASRITPEHSNSHSNTWSKRKQIAFLNKTKKVENDFFDRVPRTETLSSADVNGKRHFSVTSLKPAKKTTGRTIQTTPGFFDRLSKTHTVSSAEKDVSKRGIIPN